MNSKQYIILILALLILWGGVYYFLFQSDMMQEREDVGVPDEWTLRSTDDTNRTSSKSAWFTLESDAVENGELLDTYKCENKTGGENSIPLNWSGVPSDAGSLAIVMHHYPRANDTTNVNSYLLLWDIDPSVTEILYGEAKDGDWYIGSDKDGTAPSYTSPCSQSAGSHEYTITLYALSEAPPSLPRRSTVDVDYDTMMSALKTVDIIDTAELIFLDVNSNSDFGAPSANGTPQGGAPNGAPEPPTGGGGSDGERKYCGDGMCDNTESASMCPTDCN